MTICVGGEIAYNIRDTNSKEDILAKATERSIILIPLESQKEILEYFQSYQQQKLELKSVSPKELLELIDLTEAEVKANPKDLEACLYLATLYEMNEELRKAIDTLEDWVKGNPSTPDAYVQLISLYERLGNYLKTDSYYERVGKPRVAICLREFSKGGYNEFLVCGLSGQADNYYDDDLDEIVDPNNPKDADLKEHITKKSVIRLGFLSRIRKEDIPEEFVLGEIKKDRHERLLEKLAKYLAP